MFKIIHTPNTNIPNNYTIFGDDINELIQESLKRVRQQSQDFYKKEIKKDLETEGQAHIDHHAGMGFYYHVISDKKKELFDALVEYEKGNIKPLQDYLR